jgi:histone-lysine N-methyltransferase SUV39H
MVVISTNGHRKCRVLIEKIHSILSNRVIATDEQFLARWKTAVNTATPLLSWHSIGELVRCLDDVQEYLETRAKYAGQRGVTSRRRKAPELIQ